MRIVKEGEVPYDLYGSCDRCGCEVVAMFNDPDVDQYRSKAEADGGATYRCKCPTERCGDTIYLWEKR